MKLYCKEYTKISFLNTPLLLCTFTTITTTAAAATTTTTTTTTVNRNKYCYLPAFVWIIAMAKNKRARQLQRGFMSNICRYFT